MNSLSTNSLDDSQNQPHSHLPLPQRILSTITLCNPLLLLSPICLLYGIYRAVTAPNLFAGDSPNTIFNFVALALYVLAVCVTATLLARKRIIPDTTMLLLLHALLFVSPFILIAHGVFLGGDLAEVLGWGGMSCGLAQLYILRRRLPETYLSRPLLIGGVFILAINFAAPLLFRSGLDNARNDNEVWGTVAPYAWNLVLPLLAAWLNVLPARNGATLWSRNWFSIVIYSLWLAGTSIQLWTIAYVDDRALHAHQFTAVAWVLAWTLLRRAQLFPEPLANRFEQFTPGAAVVMPILGALAGLDLNIACALLFLNIPLSILARARIPFLAIASASLVGAACCMPLNWMHSLIPQTDRPQFIAMILAAIVLGGMAILRDSRAGVIAAFALAISLAQFTSASAAAIFNATVLFLFLHQLRWNRIGVGESAVLFALGVSWMIESSLLESHGQNICAACMVATIVTTVALRNASLGQVTSLIPPVCSIFVLLIHPAHVSAHAVAKAPSGALAIFTGFILLAAGAWHSARRAPVKIDP
jgi:hypothetical protein